MNGWAGRLHRVSRGIKYRGPLRTLRRGSYYVADFSLDFFSLSGGTMYRLWLAGPLAVFLALEVYHCARRNGWKFSLKFFAAAVLFGLIRPQVVGLICWSDGSGMPYAPQGWGLSLGFASAFEPFGWAFALYGSWFLSERILRKVPSWRDRILPLAFMATLVMGAFSYAVEVGASTIGWWHWRIVEVSGLFIYGVPLVGIMDWASVVPDFLLPFLLLQVQSVRRSRWKYLLAGIFVAHMLTHYDGRGFGRFGRTWEIWHYYSVWALGAAALFVNVRSGILESSGKRLRLSGRDRLDVMPFAAVLCMLGVVACGVIRNSGDMRFLLSILPLAVAVAMALPGVPLWAPGACIGAGFLVVAMLPGVPAWVGPRETAPAGVMATHLVPAFLPAAAAVFYRWVTAQGRGRFARAAAVAAVVLGLSLYVPWMGWREARTRFFQDNYVKLPGGVEDNREKIEFCREGYLLHCKIPTHTRFLERRLLRMLALSWEARDERSFRFAARELRSFMPEAEGIEKLWEIASEAEFSSRIEDLRKRLKEPRDAKDNEPGYSRPSD